MIWMVILLVVAAGVCAVGWLRACLSLYAVLWYLNQKNVPYPSDEEMDRGTKWAAEHMVRDLLGKGKL